jgi:lipopolysaccharide export system protein LptA
VTKLRNSLPFLLAALLIVLLPSSSAYGEVFTFSAGKVRSTLAEGRELTILSGEARMVSDATTIIADEIELWGKDLRYAMATGGVVATDEERGIILKSEQLFFDRTDEIIRVDGFIDMQDLKNDVVIRGGFFEYYGLDEIAIIQIGVRILKVDEDTELACRSEFARYLRDSDLLELSGMPRVIRNEDLYTASRISINLETDEIRLDGSVSGTVVTGSDEEAAAETGPATNPRPETVSPEAASSEDASVPTDTTDEASAVPVDSTDEASSVPEKPAEKPATKKEKLPPSPEEEGEKQ